MAVQVIGATLMFQSPATSKAASGGAVTFLLPNHRSSHVPSITAKAHKKSTRLRSTVAGARDLLCFKGLVSSTLHLIKKARKLRSWYSGKAMAVSSERREEVVCIEPYFSIPVVAPVTTCVG